MTATDELRRMLDERGVDYRVSATGYSIDIGPYTTAYANRSDTTLDVSLRQVTPEQAIAATLGSSICTNDCTNGGRTGTCHEVMIDRFFRGCGECGYMWEYMYGIGKRVHPNFCHNCGRKVVDDG